MLRRFPNHSFDNFTQIYIFKNGLEQWPNLLLDVNSGGSFILNSTEDATAIIERMALSDYKGQHNINHFQRKNWKRKIYFGLLYVLWVYLCFDVFFNSIIGW